MHSARQPENAGVRGLEPGPRAVLAARDISKSFGPTLANDQVSIAIAGGEILGLLGENGAGKSTLLSILAGFLRPDAGALEVDGRSVFFRSPADSLAAGIGLVHQHLTLVPSFTVREQLALAGWRSPSMPDVLGADFRGDERIADLPMGRRQRVGIAQAMVGDPRVLLLDEPTSILAPSEVGALFSTLRALRDHGVAIVIVTHKVREVMALAERVVVMAQGKVTGSFERRDGAWDPGANKDVVRRMFASIDMGNVVRIEDVEVRAPAGTEPGHDAPLLRLEAVSAARRPGSRRLDAIGFDLVPGRIHAIVGVAGQGQTELAEAIAGYRSAQGIIELDGERIERLPAIERAKRGLALLVDDRLGEAAVGTMSIAENLALKRPRSAALRRGGFLRHEELKRRATAAIEAWGIQPADPDARFGTLSGGNMQRVLAAREIEAESRVLLALNPVQGLDARTAALLWRQFRDSCDRGNAVLVFTTDLDEALAEADRCAVMFDGRVSAMEPVGPSTRSCYAAMMVNGW